MPGCAQQGQAATGRTLRASRRTVRASDAAGPVTRNPRRFQADMGSPFAARDLPKSVDARCGRPLGGADVEDAPIDPVRWRNRRGKLHPSPARRRRWFQFARSLRRGIYGWRACTGKLRVGFIPVRCNVSPARTRAGARDVVGTPEQAAINIEPWVRHQWRDAYWKHGSVCEDYGAIQCPVFAVGGWSARESRGPAVRCASR